MTVAAIDKSTLAVVLGSAGLPGTLNQSSVAVVLGSAGEPGIVHQSSLAAVLVADLPAVFSAAYGAAEVINRIYIGATPVQAVYLGDTEIFRQV